MEQQELNFEDIQKEVDDMKQEITDFFESIKTEAQNIPEFET